MAGDAHARRYDVLRELDVLTRDVGWPPTIRELGRRLDLSPAPIHMHLTDLEAEGLIRRGKYGSPNANARAICLTEAGRLLLR